MGAIGGGGIGKPVNDDPSAHFSERSKTVIVLAENKAKDLNLSLYTLDTNNRNLNMQIRKKIISLKNSLAYEYVDGMRGMITNGEVTISAYKVI